MKLKKKQTDHKHNEYITTADLVTKADFNNKLTSLKRKFISNKTRHLLNEKELKKLKTFDFSYFIGKSYFDEDGSENYLVFHSILKYFTLNNKWITKWK